MAIKSDNNTIEITAEDLKLEESRIKEESREKERLDEAKHYMTREQEEQLIKGFLDPEPGQGGPFYYDKSMEDPNYVYSFPVYDEARPFKFRRRLDLGYQFVNPEEFPGLREAMATSVVDKGSVSEPDKIVLSAGGGRKHYMMKIRKDRWELIQQLKHKQRNEIHKREMHNAVNKPGFTGEITEDEVIINV